MKKGEVMRDVCIVLMSPLSLILILGSIQAGNAVMMIASMLLFVISVALGTSNPEEGGGDAMETVLMSMGWPKSMTRIQKETNMNESTLKWAFLNLNDMGLIKKVMRGAWIAKPKAAFFISKSPFGKFALFLKFLFIFLITALLGAVFWKKRIP